MTPVSIDRLLEKNILPDWLIRIGIRTLNRQRLRSESAGTLEERQLRFQALIERLRQSPIAINTREANEQHYELPPEFFEIVLGEHLKYSSGYWKQTTRDLSQAEKDMLELTCLRADLADARDILEIGCGWGSLTLFMAQKFPRARITAVSNSAPQRKYIEERLTRLGLRNVTIITADINEFKTAKKFDRVVSVEMFEHARNYERLFTKVSGFLKKNGKLFLHVFTHRELAYTFEPAGKSDWMARYFFTGGTMPSNHLFFYFSAPSFVAEQHWLVDGSHYARTSEAWLRNLDRNRRRIFEIFNRTYGPAGALRWFSYWRIFFLAVAELFATRGGSEWMVNHYLFRKA